jgi:hypothetical protein
MHFQTREGPLEVAFHVVSDNDVFAFGMLAPEDAEIPGSY